MIKKFFIVLTLILGFTVIDNVSAECGTGIGTSYYDIKFVTNGGNELENMNLCAACADFKNAEFPIPTKDGYRFFEWYADEALTIPVSVSVNWNRVPKEVVKNSEGCETGQIKVTLYAGWEKNDCITPLTGGSRYNIKFITGKDSIDDLSFPVMHGYLPDETLTLPAPESDNDTFLGWYLDPEFTVSINSLQDDWDTLWKYAVYKIGADECPSQVGEINLYAKWEKNDCPAVDGGTGTVFQFETNGGNKIDNISICTTCGDAKDAWDNTPLPNPIKDGYTFEGWYADKDLTVKIGSIKDENIKFEQKIDENGCSDGSRYTTLYAKWEPISVEENDVSSTVDVDSTGNSVSLFLTVLSGILIISGIVMFMFSLKSKQKN